MNLIAAGRMIQKAASTRDQQIARLSRDIAERWGVDRDKANEVAAEMVDQRSSPRSDQAVQPSNRGRMAWRGLAGGALGGGLGALGGGVLGHFIGKAMQEGRNSPPGTADPRKNWEDQLTPLTPPGTGEPADRHLASILGGAVGGGLVGAGTLGGMALM